MRCSEWDLFEVSCIISEIFEGRSPMQVVLYGPFLDMITGRRDAAPDGIDLLVSSDGLSGEELQELSGAVSDRFCIPCRLLPFDGRRPSDLPGLMALKDGLRILGDMESATDAELEESRKKLCGEVLELMSHIRDNPPDPFLRSTERTMTTVLAMLRELERYERSVRERARAKQREEEREREDELMEDGRDGDSPERNLTFF